MKQQIILWIGVLLLLIGGVGCENGQLHSPPANPEQAILGKWELINSGGRPIIPTGYRESFFHRVLFTSMITQRNNTHRFNANTPSSTIQYY